MAIFQRIESTEVLCRLSTVSKSLRKIADSDQVWSRALSSTFGDIVSFHILKCQTNDLNDPTTLLIYNLLTTDESSASGEVANSSTIVHSQDWRGNQKCAFLTMLRHSAAQFALEPVAVSKLLTLGTGDAEEAGRIMYGFISQLSTKRRSLPDIRSAAIKARPIHAAPALPSLPATANRVSGPLRCHAFTPRRRSS